MHLQLVAFDLVIISFGQLFFQELQAGLLKLLDFAAAQAAEMIMMVVAVNMFVVPVSFKKIHLTDEAAIHKEGQRPVNGGLGDLGAFALEQQIKLIHVKMAVPGKNFPQNLLALGGAPQAPLPDIFLKYLEFGFHHCVIVIEN
jgi:hypothetical protein